MKVTLIYPAIGRRLGAGYLRLWQMEPLSLAVLAALTPPEVEVNFYDDRIEPIPFDQPTDLVAISVETYSARRAYQIASDYRKRGVPVVMGGFHPSLFPDECARYAESVVVGEAEGLWPRVIDDFRHGTNIKFYRQQSRPAPGDLLPRRDIFTTKHYLPLGLIEAGRGCVRPCEFCSIQSLYGRTHQRRAAETIVSEVMSRRSKCKMFFFVDDNVALQQAPFKELLHALVPLGIRWIGQMSVTAAQDEELMDLLQRSGCAGVLLGFESLDTRSLHSMGKGFNMDAGSYERAIENCHRHAIGIFGTFVFGYEQDTPEAIEKALAFAQEGGFYLSAFNHLVPFPGTPLYARMANTGRLLHDAWWLEPHYRFNDVAFRPGAMSPRLLQECCLSARRRFYSIRSTWQRYKKLRGNFTFRERSSFWGLNLAHRKEVRERNGFPLGDESWKGDLLEAN